MLHPGRCCFSVQFSIRAVLELPLEDPETRRDQNWLLIPREIPLISGIEGGRATASGLHLREKKGEDREVGFLWQ